MVDFVPTPLDYEISGNRKLKARLNPRVALLFASALILGFVLQITDGFYSIPGIALLTVALVLSAIAALGPALLDNPISLVQNRGGELNIKVARWVFAALVLSQLVVGIWRITSNPRPNNDVWVFHTDSAEALRNGLNPYTITFPNIYHPDAWVYAPQVVEGDRLLFGYPYPPLTLVLTSAGDLLLGDCRYSMLLASLLTAVLIALICPDLIGLIAAAIFLFTPSYAFVIVMGWTEPIQAMLLAGVVVCLYRAPRWTGVVLGLLIASKQYMPVILLLFLLVLIDPHPDPLLECRERTRKIVRDVTVALAVALIITLPFALWNIGAFVHSVITLQLHQPFRTDALGLLNLWRAGREGWTGPSWVAFVAMGGAIAVCYWRRVRFSTAGAFSFFLFFAFNKQAFANYYYLVIAALCIAAADESFNRGKGSTDKS